MLELDFDLNDLCSKTDEELVAVAKNDKSAAGILLSRYSKLILIKSKIYANSDTDSEDLHQEGFISLLKAINAYDPSQGAKFSTFAEKCIVNRMKTVSARMGRNCSDVNRIDEDEVEEQENYEPRQSHSSRIGDDNESGRSQGYGGSSSNNRSSQSSRSQSSEERHYSDSQQRHKETSSERRYDDEERPRQSAGKRRNYMGYNPDETSHRQFNVGKQEATTLETKEATEEEISRLSSLLGRAFDRDSIVDENYLVRMRFYNSVKNEIGTPNMSEKEFITKGRKYLQTKTGKYVHRCSARGGILYVSPSIWNRVKYENCVICMYYGKKANQFLYIRSQKELMDMIDKDAILVQVTGNDKGRFVNKVYDSHFPGMDGNIYTMIRTIKTHGDDFIFDPSDTSKKNDNEFDPDLV